jgi:hypothetical protein
MVDVKLLSTVLESACHPVAFDKEAGNITISVSHPHLLKKLQEPDNWTFLCIALTSYFSIPDHPLTVSCILESEIAEAPSAER